MARETLGLELFGWYAQNPGQAGMLNTAMGNLAALAASQLVRVYDVSSVRTVSDVGGALGVLLAAVLHANPAAHGIPFDLPHVITMAESAIAAEGIAPRCELVSGDCFEVVTPGADQHLLKQIVHDRDDERAERLLATCHRALEPAGELLLVEMVISPDNRPSPAHAIDRNMLVMLGSRERTKEEYRLLLGAAGFRLERLIPTHSLFSVLEATRV